MAVNKFTNGAGGNTWGTAGNWSLGTIPTAADGHDTTFDATSPNCTVNTSNRAANRITFVGYTNTITMTFSIAVSGNVTLGSGMVVAGSGGLGFAAAGTITSNGKVWPNSITFSGSGSTKTLADNLTVLGVVTIAANNTLNKTASEIMYCDGGYTATSNTMTGNAAIYFRGGTVNSALAGSITNPITINPTVSDVTITSLSSGNSSLTYTSSTYSVITTGSTLTLGNSMTIDTNGITWNNINLAGTSGQTYTINSLLTASGTLTIGTGATTTFAGTAGLSVATLSCANTTATTINFKESITYTITTSLSAYFSRTGSILLFTSSHATTKANITLTNGASCNCLASFTRIDASGGRPIRSWNGVITDCINIVNFQDLKSYAT